MVGDIKNSYSPMTADEILQLLEDFKASSDHLNIKQFLSQHQQLCEIVCELIQENFADEEITDVVCNELLNFYRRGGGWKCFCVQFLPVLIGTYLSAVSQGQRKLCSHFETILLAIYNDEVSALNGSERVERVRLPSLSNPSIYHRDPSVLLSGVLLTESALNRLHAKEMAYVEIGPHPNCSSINAENRFLVLTRLMRVFNDYLNFVNPYTITLLCKVCTRLCRSGFHFPESDLVQRVVKSESGKDLFRHVADYANLSRVNLHSAFMLEVLNGVYFAMFSSNATLPAVQALDDLHQRASYEMFADILLVTNAISNSLMENPSGTPVDGPMGIHTIVVQQHSFDSDESVRRKLVTNASLRIRKLPDDIPVKVTSGATNDSSSNSNATSSPSSMEANDNLLLNKHTRDIVVPASRSKQYLFIDGGKKSDQIKESKSEVCFKDLQKKANMDPSDYKRKPHKPKNDSPDEETCFMDEVEEEVVDNLENFRLKTPPINRIGKVNGDDENHRVEAKVKL